MHTHTHTHSGTHPLTHSPTHPHTVALTHSPTHPLTHSPTHTCTPLMQGIGLNAQGIANAILFCIFTKQIRQRLLASFVKMYRVLCVLCKCQYSKLSNEVSISVLTETTTKFASHAEVESCSVNSSYGTMLNKSV